MPCIGLPLPSANLAALAVYSLGGQTYECPLHTGRGAGPVEQRVGDVDVEHRLSLLCAR